MSSFTISSRNCSSLSKLLSRRKTTTNSYSLTTFLCNRSSTINDTSTNGQHCSLQTSWITFSRKHPTFSKTIQSYISTWTQWKKRQSSRWVNLIKLYSPWFFWSNYSLIYQLRIWLSVSRIKNKAVLLRLKRMLCVKLRKCLKMYQCAGNTIRNQ
jgi:hypothetical protein